MTFSSIVSRRTWRAMTPFCLFCDDLAVVAYSFSSRWRSLADPNTISPKNESSLTELLIEIRGTVGQEAQIVQAVFPNPALVMQVFLQRVFAQSVITRESSTSCCANSVIDPATYGAAPHPSWQHVGSGIFTCLTADSFANIRTH